MNETAHPIPADAGAPVETLYEGRWLSLRKRGRWEYAERNNPAGAVIIVAPLKIKNGSGSPLRVLALVAGGAK